VIDRDIVATMISANPAGLADAYDAYAGKLHAYCWTLLRDHDAAADAVQDTFIVADKCIGQLRDPDRLRPWLYAIARNECLRQLRASARSAPFEEAGDVIDESAGDVGRELDREQTRELVWAAAQGLNPGEYEVLELNLRHELDGADLAAALGVSRNHAHALLSRARAQFEISLAALLVARTGRGSCETLDGLLSGWDGGITALLRKRINRHIEQCETCGERRQRELRPAMLMSSLPFILAPALLRDKILHLVADPTAATYRQMVVNRAGPFGPDGFVKALDHAGNSANSNNQGNNGNGQGGQGGGSGGGPAPVPAPDPGLDPIPGPAASTTPLPIVSPDIDPGGEPGDGPGDGPGSDGDGDGDGDGGGGTPHDKKDKKGRSVALLILLLLLVIAAGTLLFLKLPTSPTASGSPTITPANALTTLSGTDFPSATDTAAIDITATATATLSASPTAARTVGQPPTKVPVRTTSPAPIKTTPSPPPTQTASIGTLVASTNPFTFVANPTGARPAGSFTVTETGGTLAGVTVDNPVPRDLTVSTSRIVRNTVTIELTSLVNYANPITLTINAQNSNPVTVTIRLPASSSPPPPLR
jgi:RNA polymerase sigma factor (sigma-70 family)